MQVMKPGAVMTGLQPVFTKDSAALSAMMFIQMMPGKVAGNAIRQFQTVNSM
jgi:hypothetical protein